MRTRSRATSTRPDQYVVITDEDLEKVPLKTVRSIEIEQFTKAERRRQRTPVRQAGLLHRARQDRPQGVLPAPSVLRGEGLTAICKVVIKDREALASLDPFADTMLLTTLHWPDEIRSTKELDLPEEEPDFKPAELAMAKQLVSAMTGEFEPEKYQDEYRDALMKVIEAKIEGTRSRRRRAGRGGRQPDRPHGRPRGVGQGHEGRSRRSRSPVSVAEAKKEGPAEPRTRSSGGQEARRPDARPRPTMPTRRRPPPRAAGQAPQDRLDEARARSRVTPGGRVADDIRSAMPRSSRYQRKRDFDKTPEPAGEPRPRARRAARERPVRRPASPRDPSPLRLPARDRRRARELGRPEGPDPRPGRSAGWRSTSRTTRSSTSTSRA